MGSQFTHDKREGITMLSGALRDSARLAGSHRASFWNIHPPIHRICSGHVPLKKEAVTPRNPSSPWEQSPRTAALPRNSALAIKLFPPPQHFLHCRSARTRLPPSTHSSTPNKTPYPRPLPQHICGTSFFTLSINPPSPRDDLQQPWPNPSGISAPTRPLRREFPASIPVVSFLAAPILDNVC